MKKTINGKRYDTSKSIIIWAYETGRGPISFSESLYRLPRGGWFIVGQGQRLSPYGRHGAGERVPGAKITPLSHEEALDWLRAHDQCGLAYFHEEE